MFIDHAEVFISAGDGGNGAVSFRHEKFVEHGGPDGGDGGDGGDVIFIADPNVDTLVDFRYQPKLIAKNGCQGAKQKMHGRNGADLLVKVPVGTLIYREDSLENVGNSREPEPPRETPAEILLADLTEPGQQVIIARGGEGGFGNAHFKSSVRQAPRVAELGIKGDKFFAKLELKLLADVGLVGFPNAGKSTFLSVVTSAKPDIADYEFTTLTPQLGVAKVDFCENPSKKHENSRNPGKSSRELLIADIPGLISGAAEGKGLGDKFLRHIERCSVILHLIDVLSGDPATKYLQIRAELTKYSEALSQKPEIIALTKTDLADSDIVNMQIANLRTVVAKDLKIFAISSQAHRNLRELLHALSNIVDEEKSKISDQSSENLANDSKTFAKNPAEFPSENDINRETSVSVIASSEATKPSNKKSIAASDSTNHEVRENNNPENFSNSREPLPVISLKNSPANSRNNLNSAWKITKLTENRETIFQISGPKITKFAAKTDFANRESLNRLRDIMKKMGISRELSRLGATADSRIKITENIFSFVKQ